jgi:hypothetical protein
VPAAGASCTAATGRLLTASRTAQAPGPGPPASTTGVECEVHPLSVARRAKGLCVVDAPGRQCQRRREGAGQCPGVRQPPGRRCGAVDRLGVLGPVAVQQGGRGDPARVEVLQVGEGLARGRRHLGGRRPARRDTVRARVRLERAVVGEQQAQARRALEVLLQCDRARDSLVLEAVVQGAPRGYAALVHGADSRDDEQQPAEQAGHDARQPAVRPSRGQAQGRVRTVHGPAPQASPARATRERRQAASCPVGRASRT